VDCELKIYFYFRISFYKL